MRLRNNLFLVGGAEEGRGDAAPKPAKRVWPRSLSKRKKSRSLLLSSLLNVGHPCFSERKKPRSLSKRKKPRSLLSLAAALTFAANNIFNVPQADVMSAGRQYYDMEEATTLPSVEKPTGIPPARNYGINPVTEKESLIIQERDASINIRAAVCHPTMFGNANLTWWFNFVSYYRLLGFDHIFIWHVPYIAHVSRFQELAELPYVTLTEYTGGGEYYGQSIVEKACITDDRYAKNYDWSFSIDADEFLMLDRFESIKSFLARYDSTHSYLSFGKYMYSSQHALIGAQESDSGFGLDKYPYTAGPYCYKNPGNEKCPGWAGRCKVLIKPSVHKQAILHGDSISNKKGGMHFPASQAHIKEWQALMTPESGKSMTHLTNSSFYLRKDISSYPTYFASQSNRITKDGRIVYFKDGKLHEWFSYVAKRCSDNYTGSS